MFYKNIKPGSVFGQLTFIKEVEKRRGIYRISCRCSCGNTTEVGKSEVLTGRTKSCGCLQRQVATSGKNNIGQRSQLPEGESSFNMLLLHYRGSAKKRGYDFNLSREEFKKLTKMDCHYCGAQPQMRTRFVTPAGKYNGSYLFNGVDRVDNNVGYEPTNVVPCCKTCQYAKRDLPVNEFLAWANKLVDFQRSRSV